MKTTLYVETTIFSLLVARPSKDLLTSSRQLLTKIWWQNNLPSYEAFSSDVVRLEAMAGDPEMARRRLEYIASLPGVSSSPESDRLADAFLARGYLPINASGDANHLAIATIHRIDFLVTWNCKHLANVHIYEQIARYCRGIGYNPPKVRTPEFLSKR